LNCKNIKSNYVYINELLTEIDMLFLQETWLRGEETFELDKNFDCYQKSSMTEANTRGRPFGGLMWLLRKTAKKPKVKFITDRISTVMLSSTVIIGVYMRFNDQKKETMIEQSGDLDILTELIDKMEGKKVIIVGDFNMDLYRSSKFDKLLTRFIDNNNLLPIDLLFTQKTN